MSASLDQSSVLRRKRVEMDLTPYSGVSDSEYDNHDEKPWQRVPSWFIILLLGVYLLLGYLTQLVEDGMPAVINDKDVARDNTDTFSEESAWRYLNTIIGDQPRVSGTAYHYNKTVDMKALVDTIAVQANQAIRTDWQIASGDYWLGTARPFVNYYQNASNIIAVLEGESGFHSNGTIGSSVLINCHYDSVPYALGASDNALFCAVMAETLNRLSRRRNKFKHNIVFLFNGAEENLLQASHAFLQHPWSKGVTAVVNLDSAGMNGKSTIFQVTDPRVLSAYRRVVRKPNAQGVGEILFSSGLIPSDTDFRIFRDFGKIYGIDIAFTKWGHVYHTRNDRPDLILPGVIQCAGDMVLGLVTELGDIQELDTKVIPRAAVYYDYLSVFLVTYSLEMSYVVDILIAIFALTSVAYYIWLVGPRLSTVQELLYAVLGRIAAMVVGIIVVAILVPIMVATTVQLRYLSQPWLVVPLFWIPYLIASVAFSQAFDSWRTRKSGLNRSIRALQAMAATRLILSIILMILICIPALNSGRYLVSVPLLIISLMSLISLTVVRYVRLQAWQHLVMEVLLSLPSTMFLCTLALRLDGMMLPIMGRSPTDSPDYIVAVMNVALVIYLSTTVSGLELLFSRKRLWLPLSAVGVTCLVLMFIPFSPYQDEGPATQRHYWFHSEIVTFDATNTPVERTAGVLVSKVDAHSGEQLAPVLLARGLRLRTRSDFAEDCERRVLCDLPVFRSSFINSLPKGLFLYTEPPAQFQPAASARVTSRSCLGLTCTYNLVVTGAFHNLLTIWPHTNVNLTSWSFHSPLHSSFEQLARPVYMIVHSTATWSPLMSPTFEFTLTFTVPLSMQSQPIMDFSHHSHKIHHPEDYTAEYRRLVESMPKYFNIASFLSFRHNYVF